MSDSLEFQTRSFDARRYRVRIPFWREGRAPDRVMDVATRWFLRSGRRKAVRVNRPSLKVVIDSDLPSNRSFVMVTGACFASDAPEWIEETPLNSPTVIVPEVA